jgi:hypothetical protein
MALQMNYYHEPHDFTYMNAYWRINPTFGITGGKNGIKYTIEVFKNADSAHQENPKCIKGFTYSFMPNLKKSAPNFIEQAYNHAKAGNYSGSVDV